MYGQNVYFCLHFNIISGQHSRWQKREQHEQRKQHLPKMQQSNQVHSAKNTSRLIILLSSWCGTITVECFSWWEELWILTSYQLETLFRTNLLSSEECCNYHGKYLFLCLHRWISPYIEPLAWMSPFIRHTGKLYL